MPTTLRDTCHLMKARNPHKVQTIKIKSKIKAAVDPRMFDAKVPLLDTPNMQVGLCSISALYRHRRRHAHCAGVGVPVLKMTASPRPPLTSYIVMAYVVMAYIVMAPFESPCPRWAP